MAKNANLKNSVTQVVKTNGVKGITGANLQPTILQVIDKLGGGYQFGGLVQPNGTFPVDVNGNSLTDQNFAFLASTPGTYTNFGGLVVNESEVCVFLWDGSWEKQVLENSPAADVAFLNRALGKYDAISETVLSQAKAGKYVNVNGAEVSASGYGISAPIQLNFGDILLVPSASAVPAAVSVISRVVTRTYAKVINYTYTYREDYPELYNTATADYDPTLVYTAVYDTSGGTPVLTGWTIGGQTLEELPSTHEVTDSYYGPLFKQAVAAMPSTGYYIYLCPQAMEVVISGYTATVDGGTCLTVGLGIFKNIVSNFLARPGQDAVAQSLCDLYTLILGLAGRLENLGDVKAGTIDCENLPKVCGGDQVLEGIGAPSVVPHFVGQRYHDNTVGARHLYEAYAVTGSTGDWELIK